MAKNKFDPNQFFKSLDNTNISDKDVLSDSDVKIQRSTKLLKYIPISDIVLKDNIRSVVTVDNDFINNIITNGIINPLQVTFDRFSKKYILISGHRRYQALLTIAKKENNPEYPVPVVIEQELPDDIKRIRLQFSENKQRESLTTSDEFNAFLQLSSSGMSNRDIANFLCVPEAYVSKLLRINNLDEDDKNVAFNLPKNVASEYAILPSDKRKDINKTSNKKDIKRSDIRAAKGKGISSSPKVKYIKKELYSSDEDFYIIIGISEGSGYDLQDVIDHASENLEKFK